MLAVSSKEDILAIMAKTPPTLLQDIDAFLSETRMGESYFGKKAAGNSELVSRLRAGGRIWPETETRVRSFILTERNNLRKSGHVDARRARQGAA